MTYTGVTSGGGFEDQLYAVHTDNGRLVNCRPAVVSPVFGGNATLAWEPTPGVVAYVGFTITRRENRRDRPAVRSRARYGH